MSRERPILFNGAMVRAILTGAKTQTRRPIKLPHHNPLGQWEACTSGGHGARDRKGNLVPEEVCIWHTRTGDTLVCPFGQPGDRLWVRESWQFEINAMGSAREEDGPFVYAADTYQTGRRIEERWRPSIHMPRWACRLVLEITDVRVERLQAISEADALAEGIEEIPGRFTFNGGMHESLTPQLSFQTLWDSTGGQWAANPWVWVIEFKQVTP